MNSRMENPSIGSSIQQATTLDPLILPSLLLPAQTNALESALTLLREII